MNGWTSVKDRLPKDGKNVLIFARNKTHSWVQIGLYDTCYWYISDEKLDSIEIDFDECVTHWQPLPEPPN